jgi:hypothetical protein
MPQVINTIESALSSAVCLKYLEYIKSILNLNHSFTPSLLASEPGSGLVLSLILATTKGFSFSLDLTSSAPSDMRKNRIFQIARYPRQGFWCKL